MRLSTRPPGPHDIVLGETETAQPTGLFRRPRPSIALLTPEDQAYHTTVFGRTGSGKSRLLQSLFLQHLSRGHGVCLIEPHHDLAFSTVAYLVERGYFQDETAYERLIYLDWGNGAFVPFNVLATPGAPQTVALQTLEGMLRVWPELRRAPAFQTLFLTAMVVLIENRLPLTALHRFLTDAPFRESCLARVNNPLILQSIEGFKRFTGEETASAKRRAFLLSFHDLSRLTLGQPDCVLRMRDLMDRGISLIVNLGNVSDGETRKLLAALLLVQIEQAALSRTDLSPEQRRPWTVLLDEWPSFARTDETIGTILSQARKFGLRMILAAQNPGQIASDALAAALENCRLNLVFALGRGSAVDQSRELASPDPALPTHPQFEALAQALQHLRPQEAYAKVHGQEPVRIRTLAVPDPQPDDLTLARVLATYKARYQRSTAEAERSFASPVAVPSPAPPARPFSLFGGTE